MYKRSQHPPAYCYYIIYEPMFDLPVILSAYLSTTYGLSKYSKY